MEPAFAAVLAASGQRQLSLLDSGCNTTVSGFRSDFAAVDWAKPVPIVGVAGTVKKHGKPINAYRAKFRRNNLGLEHGLFMRDLPMGRIIAMSAMVARGWRVIWSGEGCFVENTNGRSRCTVSNKLPYIDFRIKFDPNYPPVSSRAPSQNSGGGNVNSVWVYAAADDADAVTEEDPVPIAQDERDAGLEPGQPWSMDLSRDPADHENPRLDAPDSRGLEEALGERADAVQLVKKGNTHTHTHSHGR